MARTSQLPCDTALRVVGHSLIMGKERNTEATGAALRVLYEDKEVDVTFSIRTLSETHLWGTVDFSGSNRDATFDRRRNVLTIHSLK